MSTLIKTRTVLKLSWTSLGSAYFSPFLGDEDARLYNVEVPKDIWVDLGKPEQITVTIRPGDHLNG